MFPAALCVLTPRLHNLELAAEKLAAEVFDSTKHPAGVVNVAWVWESSTVASNINLQGFQPMPEVYARY